MPDAPRMVRAHAPVRIADCGGWTDTWFAATGCVCSLAVGPGAAVRITETAGPDGEVDLSVAASGERYMFRVGAGPGRNPLLEAAIARRRPHCAVRIEVGAAVPPGSGLGTSAAVAVALLGALAEFRGDPWRREEIAAEAHLVETDDLGLQSGVQDQQAAAMGGACWVEVRYPNARTSPLLVPDGLGERLVTVYLGEPHQSSALHRLVIDRMEKTDPEPSLEPLRSAARAAAEALRGGDLRAYGAALIANTEAQARLHPGLVGAAARRVIGTARAQHAWGWKVNGAGGDGGSVTVLAGGQPLSFDTTLALSLDYAGLTVAHDSPR